MANSVIVEGKKFYELRVTSIRWHEVERIGCDARRIVQFEVDFMDPQDHDSCIRESDVCHSLKSVIADELFFKYVSKSLHQHSKLFVSLYCGGSCDYIQAVLPEIIPITKASDEKKLDASQVLPD